MNPTITYHNLLNRILLIVLYFTATITVLGTELQTTLSYEVSVNNPDSKLFNVKCEIRNHNLNRLQLDWPAWTPGYVVLWNYGQYVLNIKAIDQDSHSLEVRRVSANRIYIECVNAKIVTINYDVRAIDTPADLGYAQAYLDSVQGWYNGAALFPEIKGFRNLLTTVRFDLPQSWNLATGMVSNDEGDGYVVQNFDELVDSPVQLGRFLRSKFITNDVQFQAVVAGCDTVDMNRLEKLLITIVEEEFEFMQNVPIDHFLFIFHAATRGGGGLEHLNATTISLRTDQYFRDDSRLKVVIAHEFFHVWNAKRIRTNIFDRYDYSRRQRSNAVWFAEGITAYYTDILLHRCNLYTKEEVYKSLERILDAYENNPARKRLSWEDISWYIWEPEFRQGLEVWLLPGWMIDLKIRDATNNRFSLDDVMRFMNMRYGESGKGYDENEFSRILSGVMQQDFTDFYHRHISGCEPFLYQELFSAAGLERKVTTETVKSLGCRFGMMVDKRVKVVNIDEVEKIDKDGLHKGDIILKMNDNSLPTINEVQQILKNLRSGSIVRLLVDREGIQHTVNVAVTLKNLIRSTIKEIPNPTERQLAIRQGILEGNVK